MLDTECWVQTLGRHLFQHTVDRQELMEGVFAGLAAVAVVVDAAAVEDSSRIVEPGGPQAVVVVVVAVVVVVVVAEEEPAAHPLAWPAPRDIVVDIAGTQETVSGPQLAVAPAH